MTATIISNTPPFGALTNRTIAALHEGNNAIQRLQEAVAVAASGFEGTPGTEYEGDNTNFGVVAGGTPGEKGSDYAYAVGQLATAWGTFWTAALPSIQQIDNGVTLP
jgi:hypothetical protein